MNRNEFMVEFKELLNNKFPQFKIDVYFNRSQLTTLKGYLNFKSQTLDIDIREWKESKFNNESLVRHRLETILEDMLEFLTNELEELYQCDIDE